MVIHAIDTADKHLLRMSPASTLQAVTRTGNGNDIYGTIMQIKSNNL